MRFLGLVVGDKAPDGNTILDFKAALKERDVDRKLFDLFNAMLEEKGILTIPLAQAARAISWA